MHRAIEAGLWQKKKKRKPLVVLFSFLSFGSCVYHIDFRCSLSQLLCADGIDALCLLDIHGLGVGLIATRNKRKREKEDKSVYVQVA